MAANTPRKRLIIIGAGFAGINLAQRLRHAPIDIILVDRHNYHLFQPLLYQVATGALAPGDIAQPLRGTVRKRANTAGLLGEAVAVDPEAREIVLHDGGPIAYDTLVVATGARFSY